MTDNTEPTIEAILDKLWKDAWGKLGAYNFDGTGEDTLTKAQAQEAIERIISDQVAKAYSQGYNDNARNCYCDSPNAAEGVLPHKHLMDDGGSHNIRPDIATLNGVKK